MDAKRLYGARDLTELRTEYDRIASVYDAELDRMGYRVPAELAAIVRLLVPADARILDAGAGTGLTGIALAEAGYTQLDGFDMSPAMLAMSFPSTKADSTERSVGVKSTKPSIKAPRDPDASLSGVSAITTRVVPVPSASSGDAGGV